MNNQPTQRFSNRVKEYTLYRPGYPVELLGFMRRELGLRHEHVIADIGSGTGKLTELLLSNGNLTYGVEPNQAMRAEADHLLGMDPNFRSIHGSAEETGLPDTSVDFVTAGQAFHWFDQKAFRKECERVLRPDGWVLIIWNDRSDKQSGFMEAYEDFLQKYSTDYAEIDLRRVNEEQFNAFFGPGNYGVHSFDNRQVFDLEGLWGRYLSCSYALPETHPLFREAREKLVSLFEEVAENRRVTMWYKTEVIYGHLS